MLASSSALHRAASQSHVESLLLGPRLENSRLGEISSFPASGTKPPFGSSRYTTTTTTIPGLLLRLLLLLLLLLLLHCYRTSTATAIPVLLLSES